MVNVLVRLELESKASKHKLAYLTGLFGANSGLQWKLFQIYAEFPQNTVYALKFPFQFANFFSKIREKKTLPNPKIRKKRPYPIKLEKKPP